MFKIFIDTNKYLDFYRYEEENKEILEKLSSSNNLIITEQVVREFKRNRVSELKRMLEKVESKEKEITNNMLNLEPLGIFSDIIADLNKENQKSVNMIKERFNPLKQEINKMINDESNDIVLSTFNKIISNRNTININDSDIAYNQALKRNNLGGVPRSDKGNFKSLTICDEYIWESLLHYSKYDVLFVTRDDTYLSNQKILIEEYKKKTNKQIKFFKYVSKALNELGENISDEAIEKEQQEQENLLTFDKLHDLVGVDDERLDAILLTLTDKEEKVLRLRFGIGDGKPKTLKEVAELFDVTPKAILRLESKALMKLRNRTAHTNMEADFF